MKRSAIVQGAVLIALCAIVIGIWWAVAREDRNGILVVSILDVGQGDAIFIDAPSGRQVLIDGGKGRSVLRALGKVIPWYDRSIDVVLATHPDQDHIGGLVDVLARYSVGTIIESSVYDDGADARAFSQAVERERAEHTMAQREQIIDLGEGAYLEILFPDRAVPGLETNTGSVVVRLVYGDTAFMLTGDAPQSIEKYLVQLDAEALASNVLKVGHHGSKTSSDELFVGFVNPEYAVFSRGCDNSYGHPHADVVALFNRFEIMTLDTCEEGTITFVSDGRRVSLR